MKFIADFHVHSKFSRATAKNLDLENLYITAQLKGITIVGTGDFTHPGWFSEIKEKLVPAEEGLYKLKDEIEKKMDQQVPSSCREIVRFVLTSEISNIYKKFGKVRKNHNLVFMPDLESAENFNAKLDTIGNIKSDGRPILGLDAKDLLEILLETSDQAFLIPAHIWTPWFSLFGSKSGFDSIDECFEDLTPHIFAAETGLSSDPAMNRRVSGLDGITLVSNSDAHSPGNLGREANLFDTDLSYPAVKAAIKTGDPASFLGTFEFYPEEGKYHMDGHRKCNICFSPQESVKHDGLCPVCGKSLTLGVLYRINELADRLDGTRPEKKNPFFSIIPLSEILSELLKVGPKSKKVLQKYQTALAGLGPELKILHALTIDEINKGGIPLLAEAIKRMRENRVNIVPGFDGEYGRIKVFRPGELDSLRGQESLFVMPAYDSIKKKKETTIKVAKKTVKKDLSHTGPILPHSQSEFKVEFEKGSIDWLEGLNEEQIRAVKHPGGPLLIVAGPGTGKTLTLTRRIAYLIKVKGILAKNILAVTFTNKAAREMKNRVKDLAGDSKSFPLVATLHSLCFKILNDFKGKANLAIIDDYDRKYFVSEAVKQVKKEGGLVSIKSPMLLEMIISAKQKLLGPHDNLRAIVSLESDASQLSLLYGTYQNIISMQGLCDYEDLIFKVVRLFETDKDICRNYQEIFKYVFVDEYQDLNLGQYRIVRALAPADKDICVIGDPDQSIYGFRGSDVAYFTRFISDYPKASVIKLTRNYRSTETILMASNQVIKDHSISTDTVPAQPILNVLPGREPPPELRTYSRIDGVKTITVIESVTEKSEATAIGMIIEQIMGGMGFHSIDFGKIDDPHMTRDRIFSDFAVLYRIGAQGIIIADIFDKAGIPHQIISRENVLEQKGIPELISLLKITEGSGSYADLEKILNITELDFEKKTLNRYKAWCYKNKFSLNEALLNIRSFSGEDIGPENLKRLHKSIDKLLEMKNDMAGMTVEKRLFFLMEDKRISAILKNNKRSKTALDNLVKIFVRNGSNTADFLAELSLGTDTDTYDYKTEKVALMTMHAAKGLEFPVVFIAGCEDGYIPYKRSDKATIDLGEERRLFYVAMTRARENLYLTRSKKRIIYGKEVKREASPFVADIETELKKHEETRLKKTIKDTQIQLKLF